MRPTHVLFNGGVFKADLLRAPIARRAGRLVRRSQPAETLGRRARSGPRGRTRGGILRLDQKAGRSSHPRRHGKIVLRGHRDRRPGSARGPASASGLVRRPLRHGRRQPSRRARRRDRTDRRPEPAQFRFFSSSTRRHDKPGEVLSAWTPDDIEETDSLETVLPADESLEEAYVPVRFQSHVTELGVLELWCVNAQTNKRWKLEFSVREDAE